MSKICQILVLAGVCIPAVSDAKVTRPKVPEPRMKITDIEAEGNRDHFKVYITNEGKGEAQRPSLTVFILRDGELVFEHDRMLSPLQPGKSLVEHISCYETRLRKGDLIRITVGETGKNAEGKTTRIGAHTRDFVVLENWRPVDPHWKGPRKTNQ